MTHPVKVAPSAASTTDTEEAESTPSAAVFPTVPSTRYQDELTAAVGLTNQLNLLIIVFVIDNTGSVGSQVMIFKIFSI